MENKHDNVIKILQGDMIGCVNTNNEEEFCKISSSLNKYDCFGDVIYMALVEQLAEVSKRFPEELCYDNIASVTDNNRDYGWAFAIADVLFPAVLSLCERNEGSYEMHQTKGLYAFRLMNEIDIQNVSDFFKGRCAKYVKEHFDALDMPSSENVFEYIVFSNFLLPF